MHSIGQTTNAALTYLNRPHTHTVKWQVSSLLGLCHSSAYNPGPLFKPCFGFQEIYRFEID